MRILREGIRATARLPEVNENMMLVSFSLFLSGGIDFGFSGFFFSYSRPLYVVFLL